MTDGERASQIIDHAVSVCSELGAGSRVVYRTILSVLLTDGLGLTQAETAGLLGIGLRGLRYAQGRHKVWSAAKDPVSRRYVRLFLETEKHARPLYT